uniref:Uncharacterized protein n=1 Tax=Arundo donax TaxID=35708 RepID=A0A0A8YAD8_ARUDO
MVQAIPGRCKSNRTICYEVDLASLVNLVLCFIQWSDVSGQMRYIAWSGIQLQLISL